MEWKKIELILIKYGYTKHSTKKIKEYKTTIPSYKMFELEELGIPIKTWKPYCKKYVANKTKILDERIAS